MDSNFRVCGKTEFSWIHKFVDPLQQSVHYIWGTTIHGILIFLFDTFHLIHKNWYSTNNDGFTVSIICP